MGRPAGGRPAPQRAGRRAATTGALPPPRRRRDRLPAIGTSGGQPALRTRRPPLRTRLDHRHQQPRLRSVGRDPRRRHGRRRPHRPPHPPRPHGHPEGQELPPTRTHWWPHTAPTRLTDPPRPLAADPQNAITRLAPSANTPQPRRRTARTRPSAAPARPTASPPRHSDASRSRRFGGALFAS